MNGRRIAWVIPALLLVSAGVLSSCSAPRNIVIDSVEKAPERQVALRFFGFKYEALNVTAIEDALHGYMEEYPEVSISYDGIKSPEYFGVLEKRLATGNGDDIFMVDHERALELGGQGMLADLSELSTLDDFSALSKSQMYAGGTVNYLPTSISAFGMYCNTDLLKEHGRDIPENLAQLEEVCDYFVSEGITPIVANNDISLKTAAIAVSMFPVYQGEDPAARLEAFNSGRENLVEAFRPGFDLVELMLERGWVDPKEALGTAKMIEI